MRLPRTRRMDAQDGHGRRWVLALVTLVIIAITLSPATGHPAAATDFFCIKCRERWLAGGILNVALFFPFGLCAAWNARTVGRATMMGLLFSSLIELAQAAIPGRDPTLSDILFNTIGAALGAVAGARHLLWLQPDQREGKTLAIAGILVAVAVMTATALLLAPANDSGVVRRAANDLSLQYQSRGASLGLDEPGYWIPNSAHGFTGVDGITVTRDGERWRITVPGATAVTAGPTVGRGWTMIAYPDPVARRWTPTLNAVWMFMLCLPVGFWSRGRLLAGAATAIAAALVLIPALTNIAPTGATEWTGAVAGFAAGVAARIAMTRALQMRAGKTAS